MEKHLEDPGRLLFKIGRKIEEHLDYPFSLKNYPFSFKKKRSTWICSSFLDCITQLHIGKRSGWAFGYKLFTNKVKHSSQRLIDSPEASGNVFICCTVVLIRGCL